MFIFFCSANNGKDGVCINNVKPCADCLDLSMVCAGTGTCENYFTLPRIKVTTKSRCNVHSKVCVRVRACVCARARLCVCVRARARACVCVHSWLRSHRSIWWKESVLFQRGRAYQPVVKCAPAYFRMAYLIRGFTQTALFRHYTCYNEG